MKIVKYHFVEDSDPGDEDDAIEKALARYLENIRAKKIVTGMTNQTPTTGKEKKHE